MSLQQGYYLKHIYYVKVEFSLESQSWISGIRNPICLVVADSEEEALTLMRTYLADKGVAAKVSIPSDAGIDVGHGMIVQEYLTDPVHRPMRFREIIDSYVDRYCRYAIQILDDRGEILAQNDYIHPENFIQPPESPKNKYVPIYTEDADKLDSGIAFVADETAEDSQAYVLTAEKIIADDGTVTIKQCRFKADGSFETRECVDGVWTEWEHVYTEEAPEDGVEYVRRDAAWKAIRYDNTPTANSKNLVDSGHIKTYVEQKVAKLYKYKGSVNTLSDLPTTGLVIGDTYNIKQKSSLTMTVSGSSMLIQVDAGDNVVWNGTYWDNLSGFVDVDAIKEYVDKAVSEVKDPSLGAGYQPILDNKLETDSKVVTSAINEVNSKVTNVLAELKAGWNTVVIGKLFPISWVFTDKPYCFTSEGLTVDFRIRNWKNNKVGDSHAFEVYVPVDCTLNCTVSPSGNTTAVHADYMLVSYYYTGVDGRDLDTVTDISVDGSVVGKTGFGTGSNVIKAPDTNAILAKWSGDNTGGGTTADQRYYEQVLIDLNAVRNYTDSDLDVSFYAAWWGARNQGYVNSEFICYTGYVDMEGIQANAATRQFDLSSLTETYRNPVEMRSYVASKASSGSASQYTTAYTPTVKVTIKEANIVVSGSTTANESATSNLRAFKVTQLS